MSAARELAAAIDAQLMRVASGEVGYAEFVDAVADIVAPALRANGDDTAKALRSRNLITMEFVAPMLARARRESGVAALRKAAEDYSTSGMAATTTYVREWLMGRADDIERDARFIQ